jgi:hypothetical protein
MIGEAVDLSVIQLRGADGLGRCKSIVKRRSQAVIGRQRAMLLQPRLKGRPCNTVAVAGFQFCRRFGERIAKMDGCVRWRGFAEPVGPVDYSGRRQP